METTSTSLVSHSINSFGFKLLYQLSQNQSSNVLISPYSISEVLTMTSMGAEGKTLEEMARALSLEPQTLTRTGEAYHRLHQELIKNSEDLTLNIANGIWMNPTHNIKDRFKGIAESQFSSIVKPLTSEREINQWVSNETHGKIAHLIDSIRDVEMILCNAIYFKGIFQTAFNESQTKVDKFHSPTGDMDVHMMHQKRKFLYHETPKYQAVQLEYKTMRSVPPTHATSSRFVSTVVLPRNNNDMETLMKEFAENPETLLSSFSQREGTLMLPRFKIEFGTELKNPLEQLGMHQAFTRDAEFPNLTDSKHLYINSVIHKAYLEVNEKGAEAAAATAVTLMRAMVHMKEHDFIMRVDRPFIFMIEEASTKTVLFLGKISSIH